MIREGIGQPDGIYTYFEVASGTVECSEVVGLTIRHNWYTQYFLRRPIGSIPDVVNRGTGEIFYCALRSFHVRSGGIGMNSEHRPSYIEDRFHPCTAERDRIPRQLRQICGDTQG